jgi:hypothetical protein
MLKGLLILGLVLYVFYKIASFFFRAGANSQRQFHNPNGTQQAAPKGKKKTNIKGGEYIDYEEVK